MEQKGLAAARLRGLLSMSASGLPLTTLGARTSLSRSL